MYLPVARSVGRSILSNYVSICLSFICLPTCPTNLPTYLRTHLPTYKAIKLPRYLYQPTDPATYHSYTHSYMHAYIHGYIHTYVHTYARNATLPTCCRLPTPCALPHDLGRQKPRQRPEEGARSLHPTGGSANGGFKHRPEITRWNQTSLRIYGLQGSRAYSPRRVQSVGPKATNKRNPKLEEFQSSVPWRL